MKEREHQEDPMVELTQRACFILDKKGPEAWEALQLPPIPLAPGNHLNSIDSLHFYNIFKYPNVHKGGVTELKKVEPYLLSLVQNQGVGGDLYSPTSARPSRPFQTLGIETFADHYSNPFMQSLNKYSNTILHPWLKAHPILFQLFCSSSPLGHTQYPDFGCNMQLFVDREIPKEGEFFSVRVHFFPSSNKLQIEFNEHGVLKAEAVFIEDMSKAPYLSSSSSNISSSDARELVDLLLGEFELVFSEIKKKTSAII